MFGDVVAQPRVADGRSGERHPHDVPAQVGDRTVARADRPRVPDVDAPVADRDHIAVVDHGKFVDRAGGTRFHMRT